MPARPTGDGLHLPPDTIRRLACDGNIVPIVLGGDGVPLDMGRAERLATREQRRALRAIYQTCAHPGCQVRFIPLHLRRAARPPRAPEPALVADPATAGTSPLPIRTPSEPTERPSGSRVHARHARQRPPPEPLG